MKNLKTPDGEDDNMMTMFELKMKDENKEFKKSAQQKEQRSPQRDYNEFDELTSNNLDKLAQQINKILQEVPIEERNKGKRLFTIEFK